MDNKPKTAKEAFERIKRMEGLRDEAQNALDREILLLRELKGSTFEHEGVRYQIRVPNHGREDRKYSAAAHPFIVVLKTTPKEAKAAAKLRKASLSKEEAEAHLASLMAVKNDDDALIVTPGKEPEEDEPTTSEAEPEAESNFDEMEVAAASSDDDDDDGFVIH